MISLISKDKVYPILPLLAFILYIYGLKEFNPILEPNHVFDYIIWFSTSASLYASYLDLRKYMHVSLYSTIGLEVFGAILVIMGRLLSFIYNELPYFYSHYMIPIVGSYYTKEGFAVSILVFIGSMLILLTNMAHMMYGPLVIYRKGPTLVDLVQFFRIGLPTLIKTRLGKILIVILIFTVSFIFRFGAELLYWPELIGWDTPEYVAHLMDFSVRLNPFTSYYWMGYMRNIPPLLDIVLLPFGITGNAWLAFKIFPSICFALIVVLSSLIPVYVYGKKWVVGVLAGFMTMFSILVLRISWDYQKQLLGTVFLLLALLLLERWNNELNTRRAVVILTILVCMVLSTEIYGLVSFVISIYLIWRSIGNLDKRKLELLIGTLGAVISVVLEIWYWKKPYAVSRIGITPLGIVSYGTYSPQEIVSYLIAGFGILLPLSFYTLFKYRKLFILITFTSLFLAGISPFIAPYTSVTTWYRFLISLAPITTILSAIGLYDIIHKWQIILVFLILFSLPGIGFIYAYNYPGQYTRSLREFPTALKPIPSYIDVYEYFKENPPKYPIIAFRNAAKYVHMAIRNPAPDQLIWLKTINNQTICNAIAKYNISGKIIIVTQTNLTQMRISCLENITLIKKLSANTYEANTKKQ